MKNHVDHILHPGLIQPNEDQRSLAVRNKRGEINLNIFGTKMFESVFIHSYSLQTRIEHLLHTRVSAEHIKIKKINPQLISC